MRWDTEVETGELVGLVKTGHPTAAHMLVSTCGVRLGKYARLVAPELSDTDRELACEKAVEAAVRAIDRYDPALGTFDTWLRGFLRNALRDLRKAPRAVPIDPSELAEMRSFALERSEDSQSDVTDAAIRIAALVKQLPDTDQLMIRLRDYECLPYVSIAEMLDASEVACRQRHLRARSRLRKIAQSDPIISAYLNGREG